MDDIGTTYMLMTSEGEKVKTTPRRNCGQVQTTEGEYEYPAPSNKKKNMGILLTKIRTKVKQNNLAYKQ